jgi:hypothetical protein
MEANCALCGPDLAEVDDPLVDLSEPAQEGNIGARGALDLHYQLVLAHAEAWRSGRLSSRLRPADLQFEQSACLSLGLFQRLSEAGHRDLVAAERRLVGSDDPGTFEACAHGLKTYKRDALGHLPPHLPDQRVGCTIDARKRPAIVHAQVVAEKDLAQLRRQLHPFRIPPPPADRRAAVTHRLVSRRCRIANPPRALAAVDVPRCHQRERVGPRRAGSANQQGRADHDAQGSSPRSESVAHPHTPKRPLVPANYHIHTPFRYPNSRGIGQVALGYRKACPTS